jgi:hypothetical protein
MNENPPHPPQDPWQGVTEAIQHMTKLGWIRASHLVATPNRDGFADIAFTPAGIEALKPFADFWNKTGGINERALLGVFWLAVRSQE